MWKKRRVIYGLSSLGGLDVMLTFWELQKAADPATEAVTAAGTIYKLQLSLRNPEQTRVEERCHA